ncbi:hypothetical protein [Streptomyces noursei]|uniref:hypothetical protein n=1 Tax=Streptomyces noursei TaxID=1971 RepID=UPI00045F0DD2|nr:hypothetical protein [Streptomyces noursei]AIA05409.1 hypothetical protein DC74_4937 [Streptomyces noursei]
MAETTPTLEPTEVPTDGEAVQADTTNDPVESAQLEEQDDGQELDADALRAELKAAQAEATKYRTQAQETAEALKAARSPEEFQAVADRATELETELHRERLARRYSLPDALAARIAGADEDAREADAKALAALFHSRGDGIGRGGLDPSVTPTPSDPGELAAGIPRARR